MLRHNKVIKVVTWNMVTHQSRSKSLEVATWDVMTYKVVISNVMTYRSRQAIPRNVTTHKVTTTNARRIEVVKVVTFHSVQSRDILCHTESWHFKSYRVATWNVMTQKLVWCGNINRYDNLHETTSPPEEMNKHGYKNMSLFSTIENTWPFVGKCTGTWQFRPSGWSMNETCNRHRSWHLHLTVELYRLRCKGCGWMPASPRRDRLSVCFCTFEPVGLKFCIG